MEALEAIGYTPAKAAQIIWQWTGHPDPANCPDMLLDYARASCSVLNSASMGDVPLLEGLVALGFDEWLKATFPDPRP